jgi:hypothetical protein
VARNFFFLWTLVLCFLYNTGIMAHEIKTWLCRKCDQEKPVGKFRIRQGAQGKLCIDNNCKSCRAKAEYAKLKLEMLEAFGWKCSCCGQDHPQFLSLEHIQGIAPYYLGSSKQRPVAGRKQTSTYQLYRMAKRDNWDPAKYECLCMNCNFADGHFGACPHRSGVTKEEIIASLKQATLGIGLSFRKGLGGEATRFKPGFDARRTGNPNIALQPRDWHGRLTKAKISKTLTEIEKASE